MRPCGSALCAATKWASPNDRRFDHVGMIIVGKDYKPMLVEQTFSGTKLRSWDERLSRSLAGEVVIRPLRMRRTKESMDRLALVVEGLLGNPPLSSDNGADAREGADKVLDGGVLEAMRSLQLLFSRYRVGGRLETTSTKSQSSEDTADDHTGATNISATRASLSPSCNSSAALVGALLQELGVMAKEDEHGYIRPELPEDLLNMVPEQRELEIRFLCGSSCERKGVLDIPFKRHKHLFFL